MSAQNDYTSDRSNFRTIFSICTISESIHKLANEVIDLMIIYMFQGVNVPYCCFIL